MSNTILPLSPPSRV